jgi:hypothetical protein
MKNKRGIYRLGIVFMILLGLSVSAQLSAQTALQLEILLNEQAVTWSQVAAFVLEASSESSWLSNREGAFQHAVQQNWLPVNAAPGEPARLDGVALLLMQSFDLKGGIFYSLLFTRHHAYRELVYKRVIRGNTDPRMTVSGPQLLMMVNRILAMEEER